jgi:polyhydroxyalkanoate synthesis repressor PhaR
MPPAGADVKAMGKQMPNSSAKTVLIKKYENRRLYDTTNSRYVNLDEVAELVKDGCDVQVLDAGTGEDLTRLVLTQIIVENAKEPNSAFPLDTLRQMVIASGKATQEGTLKYMKAMFDMYQNAFRAMPSAMTPFDFFARAGATAGSPAESTGVRQSGGSERPAGGEDREVDDLKRRIGELENMVLKLSSRSASRKKSSKYRRRR